MARIDFNKLAGRENEFERLAQPYFTGVQQPSPAQPPAPAPAPAPTQPLRLFEPPRPGEWRPDPTGPRQTPVPAPVPAPQPQTTNPNWFWGIGPGGAENERKIWEAARSFDPRAGLTDEFEAVLRTVFPGAGIVDRRSGIVDIPGIGRIDVLRNAGADNAQWWWGSPTLRGASPDGAPAPTGAPSGAGVGVGGAGTTAGGNQIPQVGGVPLDIDNILGGGMLDDTSIWNDPSLSLLEELSRVRLEELFQPVTDPYRDQFFQMLDERIQQLQAPPFTESQESIMRTAATDRLQRDRQSAHDEIDRRLAALGHDKTSGTLVQAHLEVDRQFDQLVNAQQQGFDVYSINELNRRRDQAVGLGGSAAELSRGVREEEQGRRREGLTIASLFPELQNQQLMQANAILTGSPYSGPSIFSQMLGLANYGANQQQFASQQQASFWSGLGQILGYGLSNTGGRAGAYNPFATGIPGMGGAFDPTSFIPG